MSRFLQSLGIDQGLDCMVLWKEPRHVFFGRSLGCREGCDRLAAGVGLEPPIWFCNMFNSWTKADA